MVMICDYCKMGERDSEKISEKPLRDLNRMSLFLVRDTVGNEKGRINVVENMQECHLLS